jgi:hypothetical protein
VWRLRIPFVHVPSAADFARFDRPGSVKVAWVVRVTEHSRAATLVSLEVRVSATDEDSWKRFRRYFRVIGPWSRLIRRFALRALARRSRMPDDRSPLQASLRPVSRR